MPGPEPGSGHSEVTELWPLFQSKWGPGSCRMSQCCGARRMSGEVTQAACLQGTRSRKCPEDPTGLGPLRRNERKPHWQRQCSLGCVWFPWSIEGKTGGS